MRLLNFLSTLCSSIEATYKCAISLEHKSDAMFADAKSDLLTELGLKNWAPKRLLSFVKNFSDTISPDRIDAEYYQPKYEEIIAAIKRYSGGYDHLNNLVDIRKSVEVGSEEYRDEGIPFVRVSNLAPLEMTEEKFISEALYSELTKEGEAATGLKGSAKFKKSKSHQPLKGEILFSKDATPGIAYFLRDTPQKMIVSGGILRLLRKDRRVNDEYLTLVLNSTIVQEQVNRDCGGSIILHWRPDQVKETIIPILPEDKQGALKNQVQHFSERMLHGKNLQSIEY